MKTIFVFIILSSVLFSCRKTDNKATENQQKHTLSISETNIKIPIDENTLSSYQIISTFREDNGEECIFAYNGLTHAIDVFNVDNKSFIHIQLEAEGGNGILKNVSGMHIHNSDTIWLYSQGLLYLCNNVGEVKKSIKLPYPDNGFIMIDTNFSTTTSKLYYNKVRNSVFYLTVNNIDDNISYTVFEYDINTGKYGVFPIKGNDIEAESGTNYGWKQFPNVTYSEMYINYNFPITSNVYRINIENSKRIYSEGKSKYTDNLVSELSMPYDFDQADRHILENVHFFELEYDKKRNLYYRFHLNKIKSKDRAKSREEYNTKEIFLTIFDSDLNLIDEIQLESGVYNYLNCWGVLNSGLFIVKDNEIDILKNPEIMEITIFYTKI